MNFPKTLAYVCSSMFVVGGGIELFMIKTGFYDIVTDIEAGRLTERRLAARELLKTDEFRSRVDSEYLRELEAQQVDFDVTFTHKKAEAKEV